jgi:hypothetical protein
VVWWTRPGGDVLLLGEFERCEPKKPKKLVEKAKSLLQSHRALGKPPSVLLLVGWTVAGTDVGDLSRVSKVVSEGFTSVDAGAVPGLRADSRFLLATAVFADFGGSYRLVEVRT